MRWARNVLRYFLYVIVVASIPVILLALFQKMTDDFDEKILRGEVECDGWDYFV